MCQNAFSVSPNQWMESESGFPTTVWVSNSLLKMITLFFSWFHYKSLFPVGFVC